MRVNSDPFLQRSLTLARKGKYGEAIKSLEGEVFRYQESHAYYYILAVSCLYAGDFGGAFTYFNRARTIKMRDPDTLLGMALLFLRRGDTDRALDIYLDVQDIDPQNAVVKRALRLLHTYGGTDDFSSWLDGAKLDKLYPSFPQSAFRLRLGPLPLALIAVLAVAAGIFIGVRSLPRPQRGGMEASVLAAAETSEPLETGGSFRYVLTRDQVLAAYRGARDAFNSYHDEQAKRLLNRILESNASTAIKNKARLLKSHTETPGFDNLKDRFSYAEVSREPLLYRDCFVIWRGTAANVQAESDKTVFDLLVGYDTRKTMEGAVAVELNFPSAVDTAVPLDVLGAVIPLTGGGFMIRATGIHQSPAD
ncbi:MAG: tetratricopeptide repeat protein [Treponema sp.]|jgi:tetratricopeptide (TPR) repeat protein|nr:tetratricopeptide repeat protein [Treponema sp.]